MIITNVSINLHDDGRLKAFASIELDECFVIRRAKIIEVEGKLMLCMPARKISDNGTREDYKDACHPTTKKCRDYFNEVVLSAYRKELAANKEKSKLESENVRSAAGEFAQGDESRIQNRD